MVMLGWLVPLVTADNLDGMAQTAEKGTQVTPGWSGLTEIQELRVPWEPKDNLALMGLHHSVHPPEPLVTLAHEERWERKETWVTRVLLVMRASVERLVLLEGQKGRWSNWPVRVVNLVWWA